MSKKSYVQAIRDVTAEEMRRDEKVFVMGEDFEVLGEDLPMNSVPTEFATPPFPKPDL